MLVLDGGKGLMLGYWLGCRRGEFQKQSPLDCGSQATILYVSDPNTGFPGGSDSKACVQCGSYCTGQLGLSCQTLCDLTDCSPPGSSVHGHWDSIPDFLEMKTAACFHILAWKIPRTEEPRGLQCTESQKSWTYRKMCFREERKRNT